METREEIIEKVLERIKYQLRNGIECNDCRALQELAMEEVLKAGFWN